MLISYISLLSFCRTELPGISLPSIIGTTNKQRSLSLSAIRDIITIGVAGIVATDKDIIDDPDRIRDIAVAVTVAITGF